MLSLTPKQYDMIYKYKDVDELFFGGQAGGSKSEGLVMFALWRRIECPGSVGLMLRKTLKELEKSLIRKSKKYYHPYADWKEQKKLWEFKKEFGGGIQEFGYIETENDCEQYQSAEYDDVCFDELGHFDEYPYVYMMSRLRPQGNWKGLMRSAGNPGSRGHQWIKARFVDCARLKVHEVVDEEGTSRTRLFLPASLNDNTLMTPEQRKQYRTWLNQLPEDQKRQLRDGDWDFNPGAAFGELTRKTHGYDLKDVPVPEWAPIVMGFDWGFGAPFSVGWYWVDYDGRLWRFAEWYGWGGKPNVGLRMATSKIAQGIHKREAALGITGRVKERIADPSIFSGIPNVLSGGHGPSHGEMMEREGIYCTPADNDREMGKMQFHERLQVPEISQEDIDKGIRPLPMLMIANECVHFWRTVPSLPTDPNNCEDVDNKSEDHDFDQTRYVLMSRPMIPQMQKPPETWAEEIERQIVTPVSPYPELGDIYGI